MEKTFLFFLLFISIDFFAQDCFQEGITFSTQSEIDSFNNNNPNCTIIIGNVKIGGDQINGSTITNLQGLSQIQEIQGNLTIELNDQLENLDGLDNLTSLGGSLVIGFNAVLNDLSALSKITSINANLAIVENDGLSNLIGLNNILSIAGSFELSFNDNITDLQDLSSLQIIGTSIFFFDNANLSNCSIEGVCSFLQNGGNGSVSQNTSGCNSTSEIENNCSVLGQNSLLTNNNHNTVYPNPTTGVLWINSVYENTTVVIKNIQGSMVANLNLKSGQQISLEKESKGVYFVTISSNHKSLTRKIIKN